MEESSKLSWRIFVDQTSLFCLVLIVRIWIQFGSKSINCLVVMVSTPTIVFYKSLKLCTNYQHFLKAIKNIPNHPDTSQSPKANSQQYVQRQHNTQKMSVNLLW